jgi:hypothetical protein
MFSLLKALQQVWGKEGKTSEGKKHNMLQVLLL